MSRLLRLYEDFGQSPWLDNLRRGALESGEIAEWVSRGVRGITSNPSIFAKSMKGSEYEQQLRDLAAEGRTVEDIYWELVVADIESAMGELRGVYEDSSGTDGFVSVEVSPTLAHDTDATIEAARWLRSRIQGPNLMVKVPATAAGIPAISVLVSEGISVNATLIFTLDRYTEVANAYLAGLEQGDPERLPSVASVASFFVSRVDSAIDPVLSESGSPEALALLGTAAVTQAQLAYEIGANTFGGERWAALAARGANPQRLLWASTSTKNPAYPDTLYVDGLIGPETVNDHGILARTIDVDLPAAHDRWRALGTLVDLDAVGDRLEAEGVASFTESFDGLLNDLDKRILSLADR
jgi:transaldolase